MDEKMTPADKQELGEALDKAVADGTLNDNLHKAFCQCWPAVGALLNWILTLPMSRRIKDLISEFIAWGDFIHQRLCPNWKP